MAQNPRGRGDKTDHVYEVESRVNTTTTDGVVSEQGSVGHDGSITGTSLGVDRTKKKAAHFVAAPTELFHKGALEPGAHSERGPPKQLGPADSAGKYLFSDESSEDGDNYEQNFGRAKTANARMTVATKASEEQRDGSWQDQYNVQNLRVVTWAENLEGGNAPVPPAKNAPEAYSGTHARARGRKLVMTASSTDSGPQYTPKTARAHLESSKSSRSAAVSSSTDSKYRESRLPWSPKDAQIIRDAKRTMSKLESELQQSHSILNDFNDDGRSRTQDSQAGPGFKYEDGRFLRDVSYNYDRSLHGILETWTTRRNLKKFNNERIRIKSRTKLANAAVKRRGGNRLQKPSAEGPEYSEDDATAPGSVVAPDKLPSPSIPSRLNTASTATRIHTAPSVSFVAGGPPLDETRDVSPSKKPAVPPLPSLPNVYGRQGLGTAPTVRLFDPESGSFTVTSVPADDMFLREQNFSEAKKADAKVYEHGLRIWSQMKPTKPPPTLIPKQMWVYSNGLRRAEDKNIKGGTVIFPSEAPSSRVEAWHLGAFCEAMLRKFPAHGVRLKATDRAVYQLCESQHKLTTCQMEMEVWHVILRELTRQVHVHCCERGFLMERVRQRYSEVLDDQFALVAAMVTQINRAQEMIKKLTTVAEAPDEDILVGQESQGSAERLRTPKKGTKKSAMSSGGRMMESEMGSEGVNSHPATTPGSEYDGDEFDENGLLDSEMSDGVHLGSNLGEQRSKKEALLAKEVKMLRIMLENKDKTILERDELIEDLEEDLRRMSLAAGVAVPERKPSKRLSTEHLGRAFAANTQTEDDIFKRMADGDYSGGLEIGETNAGASAEDGGGQDLNLEDLTATFTGHNVSIDDYMGKDAAVYDKNIQMGSDTARLQEWIGDKHCQTDMTSESIETLMKDLKDTEANLAVAKAELAAGGGGGGDGSGGGSGGSGQGSQSPRGGAGTGSPSVVRRASNTSQGGRTSVQSNRTGGGSRGRGTAGSGSSRQSGATGRGGTRSGAGASAGAGAGAGAGGDSGDYDESGESEGEYDSDEDYDGQPGTLASASMKTGRGGSRGVNIAGSGVKKLSKVMGDRRHSTTAESEIGHARRPGGAASGASSRRTDRRVTLAAGVDGLSALQRSGLMGGQGGVDGDDGYDDDTDLGGSGGSAGLGSGKRRQRGKNMPPAPGRIGRETSAGNAADIPPKAKAPPRTNIRSKWDVRDSEFAQRRGMKFDSRAIARSGGAVHSLKWIIKFIYDVYQSKMERDKINDQQMQPRANMEEHLRDYLMVKYGVRGVAEKNFDNVLRSIAAYMKVSHRVRLFGWLLGIDYGVPLTAINFYLLVIGVVRKAQTQRTAQMKKNTDFEWPAREVFWGNETGSMELLSIPIAVHVVDLVCSFFGEEFHDRMLDRITQLAYIEPGNNEPMIDLDLMLENMLVVRRMFEPGRIWEHWAVFCVLVKMRMLLRRYRVRKQKSEMKKREMEELKERDPIAWKEMMLAQRQHTPGDKEQARLEAKEAKNEATVMARRIVNSRGNSEGPAMMIPGEFDGGYDNSDFDPLSPDEGGDTGGEGSGAEE